MFTDAGSLALPRTAISEWEKTKTCIGSPWDDLVALPEYFALSTLKLLILSSDSMFIVFIVVLMKNKI